MNYKNFWTVFAAAAAGILVLWACTDTTSSQYGGNPPPSTNPYTITMVNISFSPSSLRVPRGTTVTWMNSDYPTHTSTSNTGVWNTGNIAPGGSATTRFDSVGTFAFHCAIHPLQMNGTITVQ